MMVTATYKVRTRNGRTVKMTGAIEDLNEITKAMQGATETSTLLAILQRWDALFPGEYTGTRQFHEVLDDTRAAIAAAKGEQ